jgi:hypothetical protein
MHRIEHVGGTPAAFDQLHPDGLALQHLMGGAEFLDGFGVAARQSDRQREQRTQIMVIQEEMARQ